MGNVFVVEDKFGKRVRLTRERWSYITTRHPDVSELEEVKEALKNPSSIRRSDRDSDVKWFYRFNKEEKLYLLVSVKYLNGKGFIITAHYTKKVKGRK